LTNIDAVFEEQE